MRPAITVLTAALLTSASLAGADVAGKVFSRDGRPVAEARVWLTYSSTLFYERPTVLGKVATDEQGRFTFRCDPLPAYRSYAAIASADGYALGCASVSASGDPLTVVLEPPGAWRLHVYGSDGKPASGARAVLRSMAPRWSHPWRWPQSSGVVPSWLGGKLAIQADETGMIDVRCCSDATTATLEVQAPGCARVQVDGRGEQAILLRPAGAIQGTIECPEAPGRAAGLPVVLRGAFRDETKTNEAGQFSFPDIPGGTYMIIVPRRPQDEWHAPRLRKLQFQDGDRMSIKLTMRRAYRVSGRVVEADGRGAAGAAVWLNNENWARGVGKPPEIRIEDETAPLPFRATYDAPTQEVIAGPDGHYAAHVLLGRAQARAYVMPRLAYRDLTVGHSETSFRVYPDRENRIPTLRLRAVVRLTGVVVDGGGGPVADATVMPYREDRRDYSARARTDSRGRFTLAPIAQGISVNLTAAKGDAMTPERVAVTAEPGAEARLVLKPGAGVRIKGRVASRDGRLAGPAAVRVGEVRKFGGSQVALVPTDLDGSFLFGPLPAPAAFDLGIALADHAPLKIKERVLEPGETWDIGTVELIGAHSKVSGKVVDIHGQPVAGATVYGSDGTGLKEAVSLHDGSFSLPGLPYSSSYLLAEKPGYRWGGLRAAPGVNAAVVELCPENERAPWADATEVSLQRLSPDQERDMLLRVVEEGLELADESSDQRAQWYGGRLLSALAEVEPDRALAEAEAREGQARTAALTAAALSLARTGPDRALGILGELDDTPDWVYHLTQFAERAAPVRPDLARMALATVMSACRDKTEGDAGNHMAYAAETYLKLGDRRKAEAAIVAATRFAERLDTKGRDAWRRGAIAARLALFDLDRALELLGTIREKSTYARQAANLAARVVATDPERALQIYLGSVKRGAYYSGPVARLAYEAADQHPEWALEMLARTRKTGALWEDDMLVGYVDIALRTRESDPETARAAVAAVREAAGGYKLRMYLDRASGSYSLPTLSLAAAAIAGSRCGDPDPRSLYGAAIALEQVRAGTASHGEFPQHRLRLAALLAFLDVEEAREHFRLIVESFPPDQWRYTDVLTGYMAAASPTEAEAAIPEIVKRCDPERRTEAHLQGLAGLAEFLARPPEDRLGHVLAACGFWVPGHSVE